ncbi:MAG: hypothetical protein Q9167_004886 [Letrouitia subvulpina]
MRLLNAETLEFREFFDSDVPKYAILSHRWSSDEVTFKDFKKGVQRGHEGFTKITLCCKQALRDHYNWVWVDTCCIDKRSSAELTEAINSMYKWYKDAAVCYVYLADVHWEQSHYLLSGSRRKTVMTHFCGSSWFTRGWTLQELLAPDNIRFYDQTWQYIGTKNNLANEISDTTGIDLYWLTMNMPSDDQIPRCTKAVDCRAHMNAWTSGRKQPSVATRMSWASKRQTSRIEDMAYCLLGLFDVNMPLLYGEGRKAFRRLIQEIIRTTDDDSIFAWTSTKHELSVLPDWLDQFADSRYVHKVAPGKFKRPPYTLTNQGLSFPITYRFSRTVRSPGFDNLHPKIQIPLNCGSCGPNGFEYLVLEITEMIGVWVRVHEDRLKLEKIDGAQSSPFWKPFNHIIHGKHSTREEQEPWYKELKEINLAVKGLGAGLS